jgi:hypothetical protein
MPRHLVLFPKVVCPAPVNQVDRAGHTRMRGLLDAAVAATGSDAELV